MTSLSNQWVIRSLSIANKICPFIAHSNSKPQKKQQLTLLGCQEEEKARGAGDAEARGGGGGGEHEHQAGADRLPRPQRHPRLCGQLAEHACPHRSATPRLCAAHPSGSQPHPCVCSSAPHRAPGNPSCSSAWLNLGCPAAHDPSATDVNCHQAGPAPYPTAASGPGKAAQLSRPSHLKAQPCAG